MRAPGCVCVFAKDCALVYACVIEKARASLWLESKHSLQKEVVFRKLGLRGWTVSWILTPNFDSLALGLFALSSRPPTAYLVDLDDLLTSIVDTFILESCVQLSRFFSFFSSVYFGREEGSTTSWTKFNRLHEQQSSSEGQLIAPSIDQWCFCTFITNESSITGRYFLGFVENTCLFGTRHQMLGFLAGCVVVYWRARALRNKLTKRTNYKISCAGSRKLQDMSQRSQHVVPVVSIFQTTFYWMQCG